MLSVPNACKNLTALPSDPSTVKLSGLTTTDGQKACIGAVCDGLPLKTSYLTLIHSFNLSHMTGVTAQIMTWFLGWLSVSFGFFFEFKTFSLPLTPVRNVYSLFDYGDFIQNSSTLKNPYIQLHSITDMTEGTFFSGR
jgi:hypothetical protein